MDPRSQIRVRPRIGAVRALTLTALVLCTGCGLFARLPSPVLIQAGDQPALFLGSEADAAQIGYLSGHVPLQVLGRARGGRVPVRIDGSLRTRGYVDERMLALRVQRRGRLRGTPVYVGPNDVVLVTGNEGARLRVRAQAKLRGQPFGPHYDGSYPSEGLAAQAAPSEAPRPEPGSAYTVPANTVVPLFDQPGSAASGELPALPEPYTVTVVNHTDGWLALRAGDGPYLIGWTPAALTPAPASEPAPAPAREELAEPHAVRLPARLANEPGALKRVAAGTKVVFGEEVIGVLKRDGYARIVHAYDDAGYVDVFIAADDDVALRGLVRAVDLSEPASVSGTATPVAAR
jgi:hypothetical protein